MLVCLPDTGTCESTRNDENCGANMFVAVKSPDHVLINSSLSWPRWCRGSTSPLNKTGQSWCAIRVAIIPKRQLLSHPQTWEVKLLDKSPSLGTTPITTFLHHTLRDQTGQQSEAPASGESVIRRCQDQIHRGGGQSGPKWEPLSDPSSTHASENDG